MESEKERRSRSKVLEEVRYLAKIKHFLHVFFVKTKNKACEHSFICLLFVEDNYRWFDGPFSEGTGFRGVGSQPAKQPDRVVKGDDALPEKGYSSHLFSCLVDGCVRGFQRVSGLERHLYLEACSHAVERKTLLDISKEEFAKRLEERMGAIPTLPCGDAQSSSVDILPKVKGWALKESRRGGRFSEKQKAYLASNSILAYWHYLMYKNAFTRQCCCTKKYVLLQIVLI